MRRITSTGTVAAPVTDSLSVERSKVRRSGCSRRDWNTVGGPGSTLICSSATRRMTASGSKTACGRTVAPRRTQASTADFNPAVWKNG